MFHLVFERKFTLILSFGNSLLHFCTIENPNHQFNWFYITVNIFLVVYVRVFSVTTLALTFSFYENAKNGECEQLLANNKLFACTN